MARFMEPWDRVLAFDSVIRNNLRQAATWEVIVYNRGPDQTVPLLPSDNWRIVPDENIGRDVYVILHHIHDHYENLPDIFVSVPGHWWSPHRLDSLNYVFLMMFQGFAPVPGYCDWNRERHFTLEQWGGSAVNQEGVAKQRYTLSSIRPYGEWYQRRIPVPFKNYVTLCCVFSCPSANILRYSREQWKDWMEEMKAHGVNSELGHFWERTFYSLLS